MLNWKELIETLMQDFRKSSVDLEESTGIPNSIISNLRTGKTTSPHQRTIRKLEDALGIRIVKHESGELRYYKIAEDKKTEESVKLEAYPVTRKLISRKETMELDTTEVAYMSYYKSRDCCYVYVSQIDALNGLITKGDMLLIDTTADVKNENTVACVLRSEKIHIGKYTELDEDKFLVTDNLPTVMQRSEVHFIYKIAAVHKTL